MVSNEIYKQTYTIVVRKDRASGAYYWSCPTHGVFNHSSLEWVDAFMKRNGYKYILDAIPMNVFI